MSAKSNNLLAKALIVSQVALSVMLLIGAGLFVHSLANLRRVNTGFQAENVVVAEVDTPSVGFDDKDPKQVSLYRQVEERVSQVPGVRAVGFSWMTFDPGAWTMTVEVQGSVKRNERAVHGNVVGPDYFAAMGLPVVLGRGITRNDTATSTKIAVINETMAREYFPGGSPIGRRYHFLGEPKSDFEVVGVVKDAKYESLREKPTPMAFYPYTQRLGFLGQITVRYSGDLRGVLPEIRRAIAEVNRNLPVTEVGTLAKHVDDTLTGDKLLARLSTFFGVLALLLASIGIYGVLSYAVARRTNEVGLRMALGAEPSTVVWMVMRDVLSLMAVGLVIGVPAALAGERWIASMLYGLGDFDALSLAAGVGILAVVAGAAAYLPARRASMVDPTTALRYE